MDNSDPEITFDSDGLCSHCRNFDENMRATVESSSSGRRGGDLGRVIEMIKKSGVGKPYDCVVGVSGGVDSSYVALQAVKLGLRPLAVHFDSGWNSELAVNNIENIVDNLGLDLYTDVVDWREMRDLQLSFLRASVANCDTPTDHAFPAVAYRQAARYGIKFIISGSNLATESILPKAWGYNSADVVQLKAIQRKFGSTRLKSYPALGIFRRQAWYARVKHIRIVKLLDYMPYTKEDAKKTITQELSWRDYGGKHHESIFTRYFQGYYLTTKFGFDKRRAHLSSLINSGQISRSEALDELSESAYSEGLQAQDHKFIAKKLGITPIDLTKIVNESPVSYREYANEEWLFNLLLKLRSRIRQSKRA